MDYEKRKALESDALLLREIGDRLSGFRERAMLSETLSRIENAEGRFHRDAREIERFLTEERGKFLRFR